MYDVGLLWLLLTGEMPTHAQTTTLTAELHSRSSLPPHVADLIKRYPTNMHPMTQLCSSVLAMQTESEFAKAYSSGVSKNDLWEYALEDGLNIIARLPQVAAMIYRNTFKDGTFIEPDHSCDWAENFAHMLGYDNKDFKDLMRLYMCIHSDHEGGNISAHATHLVGSALSDPYLSYVAGMTGLAGPLHGLANQEVLRWLVSFNKQFEGHDITDELISKACWATLNAGQVIPGYGHAVLRKTDPRFTSQQEFARKYLPDDPMVKLVASLYRVVPGILTEHGTHTQHTQHTYAHTSHTYTHIPD